MLSAWVLILILTYFFIPRGVFEAFCFIFVCEISIGFLIQVVIGKASWVSSSGSIKSHIPCNSATSSSSVCSLLGETPSSSDSAFVMAFGGLGWEREFLLNGQKGFLEEVSTTYLLISTIWFNMVLRNFCNPSRSKWFFVVSS